MTHFILQAVSGPGVICDYNEHGWLLEFKSDEKTANIFLSSGVQYDQIDDYLTFAVRFNPQEVLSLL